MPTIKKYQTRKKDKSTNMYDAERRKIYMSTRWRTLRDLKIKNDPLCEMCLEEGIVTPADDVHHIVSFMSVTDKYSRYYLAYDYNNLKSLCKKHHQLVHNSKC